MFNLSSVNMKTSKMDALSKDYIVNGGQINQKYCEMLIYNYYITITNFFL